MESPGKITVFIYVPKQLQIVEMQYYACTSIPHMNKFDAYMNFKIRPYFIYWLFCSVFIIISTISQKLLSINAPKLCHTQVVQGLIVTKVMK